MTHPPLLGPYGGLDESMISVARDQGMNAVWFHMFNARQFELCGRAGFAPCVELATFRADFEKRPELAPIGVDGRPIRYGKLVQGVCLSRVELVAEIEAALEDGMRAYRPAGVWLDYLAGAGWFETPRPDLQQSCFCPECVRTFCTATGVDVQDPTRIVEGHLEAWTRHKCERVASLGLRFARRIREISPGCLVGVYLCPWLPEEHDGALTRIFAQDPALLGSVADVYTPLIYVTKSGRSPAWGREWLEASPRFVPPGRRVQLILDALDGTEPLSETAASPVPTWGVQIFDGSRMLADPAARPVVAAALERIRAAWRTAG